MGTGGGGRWPRCRRSWAVPSHAGEWGKREVAGGAAVPSSPLRTGEGDQAAAVGQEGDGHAPSETPEVRSTNASPPQRAHASGVSRQADEALKPHPTRAVVTDARQRAISPTVRQAGLCSAPPEEPARPHPGRASTFLQIILLLPGTHLSSPTPRLQITRPHQPLSTFTPRTPLVMH